MHLRSLSRIVEVECNANLWEKQRLNTDQTQYKRRPDHTSRMTNESRAMIHRERIFRLVGLDGGSRDQF